jgi:hypothetical protein
MSNFDFLKMYDPHLAALGMKAEEYLYSDPSASTTKLRSLCEELAKQVREKLRLPLPRDEKTRRENDSFENVVAAIKKDRRVPYSVGESLDKVRRIGNTGTHDQSATITRAKTAIEKTHQIASWFAKDFLRLPISIPPFRMPEPPKGETPDSQSDLSNILTPAKEFISSRQGKWITGILAALGITFGYHLATDEEHRWNVALVKTVRIAVFVFVLALLAVPFLYLANGMTIWAAYHFFVSSIADKVGWSEYLIHVLGLALLIPFFCAVRLVFSRVARRRLGGYSILLLMAIGYNLMLYAATKDSPFRGRQKWVAINDEGCTVADRAGVDPETGSPLVPLTYKIWRKCKFIGKEPMVAVDAAKNAWFNANTGAPELWYSRDPSGKLDFFKRQGFNPSTGVEVQPVTHELHEEWLKANLPPAPKLPPAPPTQQEILHTMLNASSPEGTGVLLLDQPGGDSGAEALDRYISGMNTSAFRTEEIVRKGYGPKFYSGDASLVRDTIGITHLRSYVVAVVKTNCEKRSGDVDADLLSCDMTVNAKKFDADGGLAGATMAQGTGVGFNKDKALDQAAQRASSKFNAFVK